MATDWLDQGLNELLGNDEKKDSTADSDNQRTSSLNQVEHLIKRFSGDSRHTRSSGRLLRTLKDESSILEICPGVTYENQLLSISTTDRVRLIDLKRADRFFDTDKGAKFLDVQCVTKEGLSIVTIEGRAFASPGDDVDGEILFFAERDIAEEFVSKLIALLNPAFVSSPDVDQSLAIEQAKTRRNRQIKKMISAYGHAVVIGTFIIIGLCLAAAAVRFGWSWLG